MIIQIQCMDILNRCPLFFVCIYMNRAKHAIQYEKTVKENFNWKEGK